MSFKCCLFKLKKDQLSSYYISDINNQNPNPIENEVPPSDQPAENKVAEEPKPVQQPQLNLNESSAEKIEKPILVKTTTFPVFKDSTDLHSIDNKPDDIHNEVAPEKIDQSTLELSDNLTLNEATDKIKEMPYKISSLPTPLYYELKIRLKEGINLAVRDLTGTSDPYVKFLLNGNCVYKSKIIFKNLNPKWNEEFSIKLSQATLKAVAARSSKMSRSSSTYSNKSNNMTTTDFNNKELILSKYNLKAFVYDYDRGFLNDDLIGYTALNLNALIDRSDVSVEMELEDKSLNKSEYLGIISLDLSLIPKYKTDEKELEIISTNLSKVNSVAVPNKRQCVLNITLVEANDLPPMDDNGLSDPYVKFKLEKETYRSRTIRKTLNPRFGEQFQLYVNDMSTMSLQLSVHDFDNSTKSDYMGKASIELNTHELEKTHFLKLPLEEGVGTVSLLVSLSGLKNSISSIEGEYIDEHFVPNEFKDERAMKYGYTLNNSFKELENVGWLRVKVIRAEGLASADINGKSDPFCTLKLINQIVQTQTEYKTLNPEWNKTFEFIISDIHAILEITLLDEDKNKVYEFLGKIQIPIINIQNGKRKTYVLKDKKLIHRTKGLIELEMDLIYNPLKAVVKTVNPRDEQYVICESKFKVGILKKNIMRVKNIGQGILNTVDFVYSLFKWEEPVNSFIGLNVFIILCLFTQIYMLPLFLLLIFIKNYAIIKLKESYTDEDDFQSFDDFDEDEEGIDMDAKEQKKGFKERLNEIQEICLKIQNIMDYIAGLGERVINTFNFTVPWLTWLAIFVLLIVSFLLYMIPLRYLILIWGINKFTKKFRKPPGYIDNTEILDFLSRVPSKQEVFQYREFRYMKNSFSVNSNQGLSPKDKKSKLKTKTR